MHVVIIALVLVVADSEAPLQRNQGTPLSRAKNDAAACAKFEAATLLVPDDPEPLAELALCAQRAGHDDRARALNNQVIVVASSPPGRRDDARFARHRREAYLNLDRLGQRVSVSGGETESTLDCGVVEAVPGCWKELFQCSWSKPARSVGEAARLVDLTHVRIAATKEAARFSHDELTKFRFGALLSPDLEDAYFDELRAEASATPVHLTAGRSLDSIASYRHYGRTTGCDDNDATAFPPVRGDLKAKKKADDCAKFGVDLSEYGCRVVHGDPCTGLVGLVCSGHAGREKKTNARVYEFVFD